LFTAIWEHEEDLILFGPILVFAIRGFQQSLSLSRFGKSIKSDQNIVIEVDSYLLALSEVG